jgi:hypothetical protein
MKKCLSSDTDAEISSQHSPKTSFGIDWGPSGLSIILYTGTAKTEGEKKPDYTMNIQIWTGFSRSEIRDTMQTGNKWKLKSRGQ